MLRNLYVSLRALPFVMIAGRGDRDLAEPARELARLYTATAENGRYLELSVPTDWMDSSDLFGILDLEGNFRPGAIIDFLKKAQKDPENPYFLCLDGILLSRAEYYLREVVASARNKTALVPTVYYGRDRAALEKYGEIPALSNLFIIGTTNLDMASLPMNQKLLDQVYTVYWQETLGTLAPRPLTRLCESLETAEGYFPLFAQLNTALTKANAYMGYQLRNDAVQYLLHNDVMEEGEAIDNMICQKVLTRLQGSPKTILPALESLETLVAGKYPKAEKAVKRMTETCKATGFASYWD